MEWVSSSEAAGAFVGLAIIVITRLLDYYFPKGYHKKRRDMEQDHRRDDDE